MPLFWVRRKVIWGSDTNNQLPTKDKNNQKSIKAKNEPQQNREIYDFPEATRGLINFFFRIDIETPSCRFLRLGNFYDFINGEHIPTRRLLIAPHLSIFTEDKSGLESREREASVCRSTHEKDEKWFMGKIFWQIVDRRHLAGFDLLSSCVDSDHKLHSNDREKLSGAKLEKKRKRDIWIVKLLFVISGHQSPRRGGIWWRWRVAEMLLGERKNYFLSTLTIQNRFEFLKKKRFANIHDMKSMIWNKSSNLGLEPNSKQFIHNSTSVSSS